MNTVIIWNEFGERPLGWFVVDGDYSYLDKCFINSTESFQEKADALNDLVYGDDGYLKHEVNPDFNAMPRDCPVIVAGFIP